MKEALRCFISCIIPCGTLDVVRIVHASGRVEEISGARSVSAAEIMQAYPKHVLRKPPSASLDGVEAPTAVILPPDAELKRGKIYFLMPLSSADKAMLQTATSTTRKRNWKGEQREEKASAAAQRNRRRGRVGVWRPHLEIISEVSSDL
ncbi:hypothetical protein Cni_G04362 [Canna indica]|uniref:Uncharacterized protein n=1 Tax=Canna indica TaxID=4628 RepID=A0AAQ3Q259_9LILI|nr:hypothetical protein Cni_G04362 [Canna indica]